jgi:hypothetical protein
VATAVLEVALPLTQAVQRLEYRELEMLELLAQQKEIQVQTQLQVLPILALVAAAGRGLLDLMEQTL